MRPFTDYFPVLILMVLVPGVLAACSAYSPQQIERDVTQWYPYHFWIDDVQYRIRIPPGAMIIKQPVPSVSTGSVDDYFIVASFGFDYGRGSYDDIVQAEVSVSVSRIDDGISCAAEEFRFGECILQDAKESTKGNINQYRMLGALQWFHESDVQTPWDAYSILLGKDHYLTVEGHYWRDLAERPDMLADRRRLVEEIVSAVQKLD
jgi:hypothetical protein